MALRFFAVLGLMALNLAGAVFLEGKMQKYAGLEVAIIVTGILLGIIALAGIAGSTGWAWPFATILFSLSLANALLLYLSVGAFISFVLLVFFNLAGLLVSIFSSGLAGAPEAPAVAAEPALPLETYSMAAEPKVTYRTDNKARRRQ